MGHNLIPQIPTSARWQAVVGLVAAEGSAEEVAAATLGAAGRQFDGAANDRQFVEAVHLLAALPGAAGQADPAGALWRLGIEAEPQPSLPALLGAVARRHDAPHAGGGGGPRTDFGELSRRALVAALARRIGDQLPGLLEPTGAEVLQAAARLGRPRAFAALSRDFFGRLVAETLANWLDRILPTQVGAERRFEDMEARSAFEAALERHVHEATRIIEEFSAGWYGKAVFEDGEITRARARRFGAYAFGKLQAELRRRSDSDA